MEKWRVELYDTPLWLLQTFLGVMMLGVLLVFGLRKTNFGEQFYRIVHPCLTGKNILKISLLLGLILILLLLEVRFSVLNTFFYNGLYSSLEKKDLSAFWFFALLNAILLVVRIINGVTKQWFEEVLQIRWLETLNETLIVRWLSDNQYYRLQMQQESLDSTHGIDNIDQRIQQDAQDFIEITVTFFLGMVDSITSTIEYAIVLWGLSGVLVIFEIHIPKGMVFFVFIFVVLATVGAMWIGKPLIALNFANEKLNGNYRYDLIRIKDNAESIAFYQGERFEFAHLKHSFNQIIANRWQIVFRTLGLNSFNNGLTQGVQLLPLMLQAPRFFAGQATIGDMHQTVQAFNRLQRALSFFRNFYETFTDYRARLNRLSGFLKSTQQSHPTTHPTFYEYEQGLKLQNVTLYRPTGEILLENINININNGDKLLIQGQSGCGKTSLLRALAGLWMFGSLGDVYRPNMNHIMFIPQKPYLPQGSLRQAICYPNITVQDDELIQTMQACHLGYMTTHLQKTENWSQKLSVGEAQRIAFVRLLLCQPKLVLMDESTSGLDETIEASLYKIMNQRLPNTCVVSVGHRNTLLKFHNQFLVLPAQSY